MYSQEQMTGGLPLELDNMFPGQPDDPEMRESASIWLFEENGAFGIPRNGIEAQGKVWDQHRYDCNFALASGRVLRESMREASLPSVGPDERSNILGVPSFKFTTLEPFKRWRIQYDGEVFDGSVQQQIAQTFAVYADAPRPNLPRTKLAYDFEIEMAAPAWIQDYRKEKLDGMSEEQRTDAGLMGYGYRIEQLCRGAGTLTLDGKTEKFKVVGSRVHRQSVRPLAAFRGHCWQSALFPDGRGFGYIAYPLRETETEAQRYNIGYVVEGGKMYPAKARKIPFLKRIQPRGDDVSVELEYGRGVMKIGGATELATFHLGNAGVNGFNNQQSGVKYALDGMSTYGMIERSSPASECTIIA